MKKCIIITVAILALTASAAVAALCEKCRDRSYTKDIGECVECAGPTMSGQFKLCMGCADKLKQCDHCRASMAPVVAAIDLEADGTYRSGRWVYEYTISNKGSRSQGYHGRLLIDGVPVADPERINDFHETPWGPLYWVGQPAVAFGRHGWMPKPLAREPAGRQIPEPAAAP